MARRPIKEGVVRVYTDRGEPVDIPQSRIDGHIANRTDQGRQIILGIIGIAAVIASLSSLGIRF